MFISVIYNCAPITFGLANNQTKLIIILQIKFDCGFDVSSILNCEEFMVKNIISNGIQNQISRISCEHPSNSINNACDNICRIENVLKGSLY